METSSESKPRRAWVVGLLIAGLAVLGGFGYWLTIPTPPPADATTNPSPAILKFERDGFRYTYHVPTRFESLFELDKDPHCLNNLALEQPERTRAMRQQLEHDIGVVNLQDLERDFQEHIDKLRALGYL